MIRKNFNIFLFLDINHSLRNAETMILIETLPSLPLFAGHVSNVAVALTLSVIVLMIFVICFSFCAARQYNKKFQYETPHKALIDNMIIIPMDNICSPLISNANNDNNTTDSNVSANHDLNEDTAEQISEHNI